MRDFVPLQVALFIDSPCRESTPYRFPPFLAADAVQLSESPGRRAPDDRFSCLCPAPGVEHRPVAHDRLPAFLFSGARHLRLTGPSAQSRGLCFADGCRAGRGGGKVHRVRYRLVPHGRAAEAEETPSLLFYYASRMEPDCQQTTAPPLHQAAERPRRGDYPPFVCELPLRAGREPDEAHRPDVATAD